MITFHVSILEKSYTIDTQNKNIKNFKMLLKVRENHETLAGNQGKVMEFKNEKFVATLYTSSMNSRTPHGAPHARTALRGSALGTFSTTASTTASTATVGVGGCTSRGHRNASKREAAGSDWLAKIDRRPVSRASSSLAAVIAACPRDEEACSASHATARVAEETSSVVGNEGAKEIVGARNTVLSCNTGWKPPRLALKARNFVGNLAGVVDPLLSAPVTAATAVITTGPRSDRDRYRDRMSEIFPSLRMSARSPREEREKLQLPMSRFNVMPSVAGW